MDKEDSQESLNESSTAVIIPPSSAGHKKARFSVANVDSNSDSGKTDNSDKIDEEDESEENSPEHESGPGSQRLSRTNSQTVTQQTYNTLYLKSLRNYLTRDALPDERHYRNQLSIRRKFLRPTLQELHEHQENGKLLKQQVRIVCQVVRHIWKLVLETLFVMTWSHKLNYEIINVFFIWDNCY